MHMKKSNIAVAREEKRREEKKREESRGAQTKRLNVELRWINVEHILHLGDIPSSFIWIHNHTIALLPIHQLPAMGHFFSPRFSHSISSQLKHTKNLYCMYCIQYPWWFFSITKKHTREEKKSSPFRDFPWMVLYRMVGLAPPKPLYKLMKLRWLP